MTQPDLFDQPLRYPDHPGSKGDLETSKEAADAIAPECNQLQEMCRVAIMWGHGTADEVAAAVGRSILSIRPRISELRAKGLIEPTTERRRNASGKSAVVWRVKG